MAETDEARMALLAIDMQCGLFERAATGSFLMERTASVIENVRRLADVVRRAAGMVVLVKVARPPLLGKPMVIDDPIPIGSPAAEFVDGLGPREGDLVVEKLRVSAFYETRLDALLRSAGVRKLIVVGIFTNVGVESTVRDGWDRFYDLTVVEDACAALTREAHEASTTLSLPRFATIDSTGGIIAKLGRGTLA